MDDATLKLVGKMMERESRDIELLAKLRAHPDFTLLCIVLAKMPERVPTTPDDANDLLLQLLRGEP